MSRYSSHDPYLDPASGVLKNRFGITDEPTHEATEASLALSSDRWNGIAASEYRRAGAHGSPKAFDGIRTTTDRQLLSRAPERHRGLRDGAYRNTIWQAMDDQFDPKERVREKQRSREEDDRSLARGEKSVQQLKRECGYFAFPRIRMSARGSKPLE